MFQSTVTRAGFTMPAQRCDSARGSSNYGHARRNNQLFMEPLVRTDPAATFATTGFVDVIIEAFEKAKDTMAIFAGDSPSTQGTVVRLAIGLTHYRNARDTRVDAIGEAARRFRFRYSPRPLNASRSLS